MDENTIVENRSSLKEFLAVSPSTSPSPSDSSRSSTSSASSVSSMPPKHAVVSHKKQRSRFSLSLSSYLPSQFFGYSLGPFLQSIATIRGDLSNITAPPFVLATKSTTEFPAYWAERPSIFCAPTAEKDPAKRALLVLRWFLSALKGQQYAGRSPSEGVKKPLNAFLGELFLAQWNDGSHSGSNIGTTHLISEQVSHHPPVTACYLYNDTAGIHAQGYTCQEITFDGTGIKIKQIGHAILHIDAFDEDYLIPLPDVRVKGILTGTPYPELGGTYHIVSSSGFEAEIDFSGKGVLGIGGKKNNVNASLYGQADGRTHPLYTVSGQWNESFTIRDENSGEDIETYDTTAAAAAPLSVPPLDQQSPWESRKAWAGVIDALRRGDMQGVSNAKNVVEEGQRKMRKDPKTSAEKWERVFFTAEQADPVFEKLARGVGEKLMADKTMGVWKYDAEKAKRAKRPYHGELRPTG